MDNIWNSVPLEDYEQHMLHETVGQLELLNHLTKRYLKKFNPKIVLFLGIAGGNGLEHIDKAITREVFGIDINKKYLEETRKRYEYLLPELKLINIDITTNDDEITKADLIWAALILEYVSIKKCFGFMSKNIQTGGHLIVTIQSNNGIQSVSVTGVETIKSVGQIFKAIDPEELLFTADKFGFFKVAHEENFLPNKKSLKTYDFIKKCNAECILP